MKQSGIILVLVYVLVSTMSLSLQVIYKDYFCRDTRQYLAIGGRQITICGRTCSLEVQAMHPDDGSNFAFNYNAPPLYFQWPEYTYTFFVNPLSEGEWSYADHYQFTYSPSAWQPPWS